MSRNNCFVCAVCTRRTRFTGTQSLSAECCSECYQIAGIDNLLNDCPNERVDKNYRQAIHLLGIIADRGGDISAVIAENLYAFP